MKERTPYNLRYCVSLKGFICVFNFLILGLLILSCAPVGPNFQRPEVDYLERWIEQDTALLFDTTPDLSNWWQVFNDPVLNDLVTTARQNNNTLEIAGLRVMEARAQLGIAVGGLYPQSQIASGDATFISTPDNSGVGSSDWSFNIGASAAWEIDFWGKFRRGIESSDAAFLASVANYEQSLVSLSSLVVDTYTIIRAAEEQLRIAYENVDLQQKSFNIAKVLYENGETSELDMQQVNTLLLSTKATIPNLEIQIKLAKNTLSTLLGRPPGAVDSFLVVKSGIPIVPEQVSIGFPADMLRRRPDVRQAELLAMSQNALVGVAESELYPSFSLFGSIGLAAGGPGDSNFGDLFDADALTYSVGPSFVWPFLNYGRIKNRVRVEDARLQQALINYREVVLQAAREAEDAMASYIGTRKQAIILAQTVKSAERSVELSTLRYQEGFSDYQRVLDSLQALFNQQQRYITIQSSVVSNLVSLYTALGGGWQSLNDRSFISSESSQDMQRRTDWGELLTPGLQNEDSKEQRHTIDW